MSQQHDETNRFVLFKNKDKQSDSHPDYKGKFTDAEGREYFCDAWIKTPKNGGDKFMSGKVKLKDKQPSGAAAQPSTPPSAGAGKDLAEEQIPF